EGRRGRISPREDVLGVVELGARDPPRAGHLARAEHALVGLRGAHAAELPDARPEVLDLIDRPAPELVVVGELAAVTLPRPAHEAGHLGALAILGRGLPQWRLPIHAGHAGILAFCEPVRAARRVPRARATGIPERGHRRSARG